MKLEQNMNQTIKCLSVEYNVYQIFILRAKTWNLNSKISLL